MSISYPAPKTPIGKSAIFSYLICIEYESKHAVMYKKLRLWICYRGKKIFILTINNNYFKYTLYLERTLIHFLSPPVPQVRDMAAALWKRFKRKRNGSFPRSSFCHRTVLFLCISMCSQWHSTWPFNFWRSFGRHVREIFFFPAVISILLDPAFYI